ncbi:MAG: GyrI-like domain-containing protein [Planctomycetes bacterium]|nr:GyrI-like domain-containing protein [Planctomycetota bacterium]
MIAKIMHFYPLQSLGFAAVLLLLALPVVTAAQRQGSSGKTAKSSAAALNLFELHKKDYVAGREPALIDIPPAKYLTLVGKGAPGGEAFVTKIGVMYRVAYGAKMRSKFAGRDFAVGILEALWWGTTDRHNFVDEPRETWNWKILIRVPDFITEANVRQAFEVSAKRSQGSKAPDVKLETLKEGRCIQVLHVGPYSTEPETIAAMKALAKEKGLTLRGEHHEIYLSDPNTTPPDKLKTILRQPVK